MMGVTHLKLRQCPSNICVNQICSGLGEVMGYSTLKVPGTMKFLVYVYTCICIYVCIYIYHIISYHIISIYICVDIHLYYICIGFHARCGELQESSFLGPRPF